MCASLLRVTPPTALKFPAMYQPPAPSLDATCTVPVIGGKFRFTWALVALTTAPEPVCGPQPVKDPPTYTVPSEPTATAFTVPLGPSTNWAPIAAAGWTAVNAIPTIASTRASTIEDARRNGSAQPAVPMTTTPFPVALNSGPRMSGTTTSIFRAACGCWSARMLASAIAPAGPPRRETGG